MYLDSLKKIKIENRALYQIAEFILRILGTVSPEGKGEKLFVNSFPKSGTHLLTSILGAVDSYHFSGKHLKKYEVNNLANSENNNFKFSLDQNALRNNVCKIKRGQYLTTHLPYEKEIVEILDNVNFAVVNIIRDPRAIALSEAHYIRGLKRHFLHKEFINRSSNIEEAVKLVVDGFEYANGCYPGLNERLASYFGWIEDEKVTTLKFEKMVGSDKGGSDDDLLKTIISIISCIGRSDVDANSVIEVFKQQNSATLRKGLVNSWENELSKDVIDYMNNNLEPSLKNYDY